MFIGAGNNAPPPPPPDFELGGGGGGGPWGHSLIAINRASTSKPVKLQYCTLRPIYRHAYCLTVC